MTTSRNSLRPLEVWWPAGQCHLTVYLLQGLQRALVDTAAPGGNLLEVLGENSLAARDIDMVLNTHGHPDHTGGNAPLKASGAPQICIHSADAIFLEDHEACFDQYYWPVAASVLGRDEADKQKTGFVQMLGPNLSVDRSLRDNDLIDLGAGTEVRVVHLPGHTAGSVGFLLEKDGVLISGDSIPGLGGPDGGLPVILDLDAYKASLARLLELQISTLHTTHPFRGLTSGPAGVREGEEVQTYLRESLQFADLLQAELQNQIEQGPDSSLTEVTDAVMHALPAELGFKPVAELPMPDMTWTTIFWNMQRLTKPE